MIIINGFQIQLLINLHDSLSLHTRAQLVVCTRTQKTLKVNWSTGVEATNRETSLTCTLTNPYSYMYAQRSANLHTACAVHATLITY